MPLKGRPWGRDLTPEEKEEQEYQCERRKFLNEQAKEEETKREEQEYQKFLNHLRRAVKEGAIFIKPYGGPRGGSMGDSKGSYPGWRLD